MLNNYHSQQWWHPHLYNNEERLEIIEKIGKNNHSQQWWHPQFIRQRREIWNHRKGKFNTYIWLTGIFLYARLQTGSIMVWWCPSGSPSGSPSVRPTLRPSGLRPPIFRTFLLHALTYWAEILHMTLFWCTTDQVRLSLLCVNFWRSYASLWT